MRGSPAREPAGGEESLDLAGRLRRHAGHCARFGSPLSAAVLTACADDAAAGGPVADLLADVDAPAGSALGLRLLAALHRLVLTREAPALALHYPTVGGSPGPDAGRAAVATVAERSAALAPFVRRPVQTNEVGRTAALLGGLLHLQRATGRPVRLLELGSSAGLALRVDRYAVEAADGRVLGDPASPVRLPRAWVGEPPPHDDRLRLVEARGCDPAPLDPTTAEGRLVLSSSVWADQVERFARLGAALRVAAAVPARVDRAGAATWLADRLAEPARDDALTVVWHAVVWQYVPAAERAAVLAALDDAGRRGLLAHLRLEPDDPSAGQEHRLRLTTWRDGQSDERLLGQAPAHGLPVTWGPAGG